MYLKSLEIKGFKSFADNTELNLEPGINIVVGPNGCGKSNIVDAIRWVLGEANVRHLRGNKNEDVIFNGTDKKRSLGMAQVAMTIDNSDGSLPLEYNEVSVTRKIFRSGESEFYLNKSRVRMKDIIKLFTDTGLGKRGYSIISQGELERVLNSQAFERRLMLEEAAGTMKYRQQRDEVQQRLGGTNQDLVRVRDILNELEIRKSELQSKAEKAESYVAARDEIEILEKQVMGSQIMEMTANLATKGKEIDLKNQDLQEISIKLENLKHRKKQVENDLETKQADISRFKDNKYEIEAQLNRMQSEVKLSQERIKNYQERIAAANNDNEKYTLMLQGLEKDLQIKKADFDLQKEQYRDRDKEVLTLRQEINQLQATILKQEELFEQQKQQVYERANKEAEIKNEIISLYQKINRAQEKRARLEIRLEENEGKLRAAHKRRNDLIELQKQHGEQKEVLAKRLAEAEELKSKNLETQSQIEKEYSNIHQDLLKLEHRLMAITEQERNYAGYSEGVRSVLQHFNRGEPSLRGIKGLIANLIETPPGMELAMDVALGRGFENIVMENAESAQLAISFLKHKRLGRVTFLPLDVLRVQKIPDRQREAILAGAGVIGLACELLQYDQKYEKAITYLLGRVLVVKDLDWGLKIFKRNLYPLRIVSLEGELINTSGALTGGLHAQAKSSPLQRKREERNIIQELEKLRNLETKNLAAADLLARQMQELNEKLVQAKNGLAEVEFQIKMVCEEEQRLQATIDDSSRDAEIYNREINQLEAVIKQSNTEIVAWQEHHNNFKIENEQSADDIEKIKADLEINRREYEVRKERLASHQEQLTMKQKELENIEKNMGQFEQVKESYRQSRYEVLALQQRLQQEVDLHNSRIQTTAVKEVEKQAELNNVLQTIELIYNNEKELSLILEETNNGLQPLQQEMSNAQEQIRALEMKTVRIETELEGLHSQFRARFSQPEFQNYGTILSPRQNREYRNRLVDLKTLIDSIGPVDIDAIKEYDIIKQRYEFLYQQSQDLTVAIESLGRILQETEKIMTKNFSQFMELANKSFNRTFVEIFNGGDAALVMESPQDLTDGVDILVKMPGKRSQSLNLLSGGERALTCIAFIFSLLRLKPVPFCMLDEIDAALDEINLTRFTDFLRSMSKDTQFIVITHRQSTIEAGGNIYGITMPQEGISSVLSIQCNDEMRSMAG
ncbi:MAG: chromosome segregation protein SMC [Syntrophomonas sp.]|nr:chromosome segregation protein SMC [Syntrophomonas sp.]